MTNSVAVTEVFAAVLGGACSRGAGSDKTGAALGAVTVASALARTGVPHTEQNFFPAATSASQPEQRVVAAFSDLLPVAGLATSLTVVVGGAAFSTDFSGAGTSPAPQCRQKDLETGCSAPHEGQTFPRFSSGAASTGAGVAASDAAESIAAFSGAEVWTLFSGAGGFPCKDGPST